MPSGGPRQGTPGKKYPNRSDMRTTQPVRTAPGQPYGLAQQQAQSQQQMPLQNANGALQQMGQTPNPQQLAQQQQQIAMPPGPGELPPLISPSARPTEPVTHGAASGPGGGPEVLQPPAVSGNIAATLSQLAQASGNAELQALAQRAQGLGQ